MPEVVVMSWCGVNEVNYRREGVSQRDGWGAVPAGVPARIHAGARGHTWLF